MEKIVWETEHVKKPINNVELNWQNKWNSISSIILKPVYVNQYSGNIPLNNALTVYKAEDEFTEYFFNTKKSAAGRELQMELRCKKPEPLTFIDIVFSFKDKLVSPNALYLNNACNTNEFVAVDELKDTTETVSREVLLIKNKAAQNRFNIAFTSFERFLTCFKVNRQFLTVRYYMENKALYENEIYRMESFVVDEDMEAEAFLECYGELLAQRYPMSGSKELPCGWSSWSCFYKDISQKQIEGQIQALAAGFGKLGAKIIQLDDGWQKDPPFSGEWVTDTGKFKDGMEYPGLQCKENGMIFGLWYAPGLFAGNSEFFRENLNFNVFYNGVFKEAFNIGGDGEQEGKVPVYPLDISNPDVLDYLKSVFKYAVEHYGVKYFKLDFLVRSLIRSNGNEDIITYPGEYCAAVFRNFFKEIKSTVGEDVFILGCGAPIGECIGIMDAMRISPDITWGAGAEGHPGYWNLIRRNTGNVLLRSFYHRKVFLNDPDGLVLRDYQLAEDDFCCTPDEARVWATTVALSGGAIILNEDLLRLSRERLELFKEIIPPFGEAAKPLDFFEQPMPSTSYISLKGTQTVSRIIAVYNWEDKIVDRSIELGRLGISSRVFAVDCWEKEMSGVYAGSIEIKSIRPHSAEAFLLREIGDRPLLLFCDNNFYLGTDRITSEFKEEKKELVISFHGLFQEQAVNMYIYLPEGYVAVGKDYATIWTEYGTGRVIKVVTAQPFKQKRIIISRED